MNELLAYLHLKSFRCSSRAVATAKYADVSVLAAALDDNVFRLKRHRLHTVALGRYVLVCSHQDVAVRRGKLLNVRDASASQITNNAEITNIKQIMGLQYGKVPPSAEFVRVHMCV